MAPISFVEYDVRVYTCSLIRHTYERARSSMLVQKRYIYILVFICSSIPCSTKTVMNPFLCELMLHGDIKTPRKTHVSSHNAYLEQRKQSAFIRTTPCNSSHANISHRGFFMTLNTFLKRLWSGK